MWSLTLYTSQVSPWCSIVDTFLRYEGIHSAARVEVEPYTKRGMDAPAAAKEGVGKRLLPTLSIRHEHGLETVEKALEIVDRLQELMEEQRYEQRLPRFKNAQKNACMKINQEVLPVLALNRHLTLSSSRETVRYMSRYREEWGWWRCWLAQVLVPVFYWRNWRKMGNAILKDSGFDSPEAALTGVLERWQKNRGNEPYFGGSSPNLVDVWLFGHIVVCRDETVFQRLIVQRCPDTMVWFTAMDGTMSPKTRHH